MGKGSETETDVEEEESGADPSNLVSRDIAAQQEQQKIEAKKDGTSLEKSGEIAENNSLPPKLSSNGGWRRLPAAVVQLSQSFTVIGGICLVLLWSLVGRRRVGSGSPSNGNGGSRRSSLLPLFWRTSSRARRP